MTTHRSADFEILDQTPAGGPPLPAPIASLSQFTFVYQVPAPFLVRAAEITGEAGESFSTAQSTGRGPTLVCRPQADGPEFLVNLDLAGDEQELIPYGIEFRSLMMMTLPDGSGHAALAHILAKSCEGGSHGYRTRVLDTGPQPSARNRSAVTAGWNNAIVTPFLESLNLVRSGLPCLVRS